MPRVRVILDPRAEAALEDDAVIRVADDATYWQARRALRWRMKQGTDVLIWVTAPALVGCFDDLKALDGVEVIEYDLRRELARALGYSELPPLLTDELIRDLDLQRRAETEPPRAGEVPTKWVLRITLGEAWGRAWPRQADASEVVQLLADRTPEALIPLISDCMSEWAADDRLGHLWRWLAEAPGGRARAIVHVYATSGYGDTASQWLQQEGIAPDEAAGAKQHVAAGETDLAIRPSLLSRKLRQLMGTRLKALLAQNGVPAVDAVTVGTPEELQQVEEYLVQHADGGGTLTTADTVHLTRLVGRLPDNPQTRRIGRIAAGLADRPLPSSLPPDADWPRAAHWLETEYLPAWVPYCLTGRTSATDEAAVSFEKWLLSRYQAVVGQEKAGLHTFCCEAPRAHAGQAILVILLDGAPAPLVRAFSDELLQHTPLCLAKDGLMLSLLPTRTTQNRRSLLSGRLPDQAGAASVSDLAKLFGVEAKNARVVSELADVRTLRPGEVIFYHHRTIDKDWLHGPHKPLLRWLGAAEALDGLMKQLSDIVVCAQEANTELLIGCVSDHGWSEVPRDATQLRIPDELADRVSHGRVLDGHLDAAVGHPLERRQYYLEKDCTIASGHTVLGRRPQGAVHGGATPQEAVVYGFWATTSPLSSVDDLGFEINGTIRRAVATNSVQVTITNPNPEPVTVSTLVLDGLTLAPGTLPITIEGGRSQQAPADCPCPGRDRRITLRGTIEWTPRNGARRRQVLEIVLPTVGAAESDQAFEDMFQI